MANCKNCGDSSSTEDSPQLPASTNTVEATCPDPAPAVTTTVVQQVSCSTIKDECHSCPEIPNPFAKIKLTNAFALPACDQEVEAIFDEDISNLMVGLTMFAVDSAQKTIRLKITAITPDHKLTLKNICSSCCGSTKPVGETVVAGTYFTWGLPDCCSSQNSSSSDSCLIGTFFFPASGQTAAANVANANNFVVGGLYSLGGFIWKVTARVTSAQILLQNPAPGNGSTVGGFIEGGTDGECVYPITPISEASECDDAGVSAVTLIGCTNAGKKKLIGDKACGIVVYNAIDHTYSVKDLLDGSSVSGPHFIQWDKDNPCNSRLVHSPSLVGGACGTITEPLFLTPANTSNQYEISVSTTAPFTTTAPGNIVTLNSRQFTVVAIVTPGTPGKIRLEPRFSVVASETIVADNQICVVEGCQPFSLDQYTLPANLDTYGEKVFCSSAGLRTTPRSLSNVEAVAFTHTADIGGIESTGVYSQPVTAFTITNPSTAYSAKVLGQIEYTNELILDDDGEWECQTYYDNLASPVTLRDRFFIKSQNGQQRIDVRMVTSFAFTITPGAIFNFSVQPKLECKNGSANAGLLWGESRGLITYQLVSI